MSDEVQFVYDGREGRTRAERVHVAGADGGLDAVAVHRVVNVVTDPRLKGAALEGTLNRLPDGTLLAVPYAYHDPAERRFVLVVPASMAHRTLTERAALLRRLAEDTAHRVPPYVAEAPVVVGAEGLRAHLEAAASAASSGAALGAREEAIASREAELVDREARLQRRAESVTAKEDDLRLELERIDALRRELELREQQMQDRFAALREREAALAEADASDEEPLPATATEPAAELASSVRLVGEAGELSEPFDEGPSSLEAAVQALDDEDIEELDAGEAQLVSEDDGVEALDEVEALDAVEALDEVEEIAPGADDVVLAEGASLIESGEVETLDEADLVPEETDAGERTAIHRGEEAPISSFPAAVTPPESFFEDRQVQALARMGSDGPWLFVRLGEGHEDAFRGDDVELLVQYVAVDEYPVLLLSIVERGEGRPYVRRAALDPKDAEDRALLEALHENALSLTAAFFSPAGRYERTRELAAPERRTNLSMALERAARTEGRVDRVTAMERALAAPPPVRLGGHPFHDAAPAEDAKEAAAAVGALAKWSTPAKLDMALLALSLPRELVDDCFRRILEDALRHGIALPPNLVSRAVSLGVAAEPGELVVRLIDAFRGTARLEGRGGLRAETVARNWEKLLELANEHEVALDQEAHDAAWRDIAAVRADVAAPQEVDLEALGERTTEELLALLEHPGARAAAAEELLGRDDAEVLGPVFRAVRKMPRDEVLRVAPRVLRFGEAAADALI
ncbi:MAG TPA: hypothetical protein RMG45_13295, partial [Polyangiaceae bacterium LLY-WYZ-15_(1-7)]|nr:hypothetical protein [Polyangiaceae bacterium LLY-WYZ-15_(1-7)]